MTEQTHNGLNGDEIDVVIELEDDNWIAIEINLGSNKIDDAARSLIRI